MGGRYTKDNRNIFWFFLVVIWLCCPHSGYAEKDVRLALLVGNQHGWTQDPKLNYVISGDLVPMAKTLKRLGFQIHATVINQKPDHVRVVFQQLLKRLQQSPQITTFFFYYTGHADREHFHMGPRGSRPLSYREFVKFLQQVRVQRRFALIDACFSGEIIRHFGSLERFQDLRQKGAFVTKGVDPHLAETDLRKYFPNQGNRVKGLQILSSSRFLSYESRYRKGSVFTYHFLQGLQGEADLDKDGKISMNELFLYTRPRVRKETGQSPQQWIFRIGGENYGFAPVYRSTLVIQAGIEGQLQVAVDNFLWQWQKRKKQSIRLAVTAGMGQIGMKTGQRCRQQHVFFPVGRSVVLDNSRWYDVRCGHASLISKATLTLPSAIEPPRHPEQTWSLELQGGLGFSNGIFKVGGDLLGMGQIGLRHRYFAVLLGIGGTSVTFTSPEHIQLLFALRGEGGYRKSWGIFDLFVGGYVSVGMLLQDVNQDLLPVATFQVGLSASPALWVSERWAIVLSLDAGLIPAVVHNQPRVFFHGSTRLGLRYRFGE